MNVLGFFINVAWRSGTTRQTIFFGDGNGDDMMFSSGAIPPTLLAPQFDASVASAAGVATQPMWAKAQQQIDSLKQIDPDFNQIAFLDFAAKAWTQAQTAEGAMDASGATDVVTPAYATNLKTHIDDWKNQGFRRVISGLKLDGTTLYKVSLDGVSQSLVVRMAGSGIRYTQDTASGTAEDGSMQSETFTEFATFVRPAGTVTPKTAALGGQTHCPSCGAPAPATATVCPFCNTPLTPGGSPWLLDHVSQSAYT
jgi:predicted lipid-binding transport protein (Tim44 family)